MIGNEGPHAVRVRVKSAYATRQQAFILNRGDAETRSWSLRRTAGWYDLTVTIDDNPTFTCQLAGHVENGRDSFSDPAMGRIAIDGDDD